MQNPTNWQAIAINRLISDTQKLAQAYTECFNNTTDESIKILLNELTPNIANAELLLNHKLREITKP